MTISGGDLVTSETSRNTSSREVFGRRLFDPMESADGPAILGPETISYPDLLRRVDSLGSRLRKAGVREETRVGICLDPTPSYVIALFAVIANGRQGRAVESRLDRGRGAPVRDAPPSRHF